MTTEAPEGLSGTFLLKQQHPDVVTQPRKERLYCQTFLFLSLIGRGKNGPQTLYSFITHS